MTKLIDSIDPEIIVRIGLLITVLGFFTMAIGFLIWLCGEMLRACL
jgi:hypothetical protein